MNASQLSHHMKVLFGDLLVQFKDQGEYGFNNIPNEINRIGYCTNITPEVIKQAYEKNSDLIITHHDAWDFVFGMREECVRLLKQYDIGHYFVHLPLDYVEFGTCNSLFKSLGGIDIIQQSYHHDDDSVIGIGELTEAITFSELVDRFSNSLGEEVKAWRFNENLIKRIGMITGAGNGSNHIRDALNNHCDVYITGEKTLYTVQYANFVGINLIVGSHTFTEIHGVASLAEKIKEEFPMVEIILLEEEHIE